MSVNGMRFSLAMLLVLLEISFIAILQEPYQSWLLLPVIVVIIITMAVGAGIK